MILRGYQEQAVEALGRHDRVLLYSPTGSGKTEMAMELIRRNPRKSIWFLCHRIGLVAQTSRRFEASGIEHGILQGANTSRTYEDVLIGTVQTVSKRVVRQPDIIIVDEAHNAPGSSAYRKIINAFPDAKLVGLTATPFADGMGPMFRNMVVAATIPQLIERGFLVDVDIYAPAKYQPNMSGVSVVAGDWHQGEVEERVTRSEILGGIVEHWEKLARNKPTVIFAHSIKHSKALTEAFQDAGYRAAHIDCHSTDDYRESVNKRFAERELDIVSNVAVYSEGWDAPLCEVMVLARPTRSMTRYIQMAGRILRPFSGKQRAMILDHSDTCTRLGFPTDDLPLSLSYRKPEKRWELDAVEKHLPTCPSCHAIKRAGEMMCSRCGHMPTPKATVHMFPGELQRLSRDRAGNMPATRIVQPRLDAVRGLGKQAVFSQLLGIARERAYKEGWAAHKFKEIWGEWPRKLGGASVAPSNALLSYVRHLDIKYHAKGAQKRSADLFRALPQEAQHPTPPWA